MTLAEEDRQLVLLSLALCALERPGFDAALRSIAEQLAGVELFEHLKECNASYIDVVDRLTRRWASDRITHAEDHATFINPTDLRDIEPVNLERAKFQLPALTLDEARESS